MVGCIRTVNFILICPCSITALQFDVYKSTQHRSHNVKLPVQIDMGAKIVDLNEIFDVTWSASIMSLTTANIAAMRTLDISQYETTTDNSTIAISLIAPKHHRFP